jgi:hypothetical protein
MHSPVLKHPLVADFVFLSSTSFKRCTAYSSMRSPRKAPQSLSSSCLEEWQRRHIGDAPSCDVVNVNLPLLHAIDVLIEEICSSPDLKSGSAWVRKLWYGWWHPRAHQASSICRTVRKTFFSSAMFANISKHLLTWLSCRTVRKTFCILLLLSRIASYHPPIFH